MAIWELWSAVLMPLPLSLLMLLPLQIRAKATRGPTIFRQADGSTDDDDRDKKGMMTRDTRKKWKTEANRTECTQLKSVLRQ